MSRSKSRRPGPQLTMKDRMREAVAELKQTSWLERSVIFLILFFFIQVTYYVFLVPGDSRLDTALTEKKTEIAAANLAMTAPKRNQSPTPVESKKDVLERLNKIDEDRAGYKYDPSGKRDPFLPFDFSPKTEVDETKTPLERYDLGQLKLTAVLEGFDKPRAIVENAAGKGFTVIIGTKIGRNNGVVTEIAKDKVIVREHFVDFTGLEQDKDVELRLRIKTIEENTFKTR